MGAAPMAYVLWQDFLNHSPANPNWPNRDRFVLSAGHGSMLLYSLLHLSGYDLSMDEIKSFRQWGSKTPGHPEFGHTVGVEATTGPLGQGTANGVGMAMAEKFLAATFNQPDHTLVDHFTYVLCGDGDLMEGLSAEAASLAGHLGLGKLIYLYDSNDISLDGPTAMAFTENVAQRYKSYGWQVIRVENGDTDLEALHQAISDAKADTNRPTLIEVKTTIGFGSPNKAGTSGIHGSPLGEEELSLSKQTLGWHHAAFTVPEDVATKFLQQRARGMELETSWNATFESYQKQHPKLAEQWQQAHNHQLPATWDADLPRWSTEDQALATRASAGQVLNALAKNVPWLIGGDADLSCSTKTGLKENASFTKENGAGRNIHFGVREHAMSSIANGMCYHGGVRPFVSTFFCFLDYLKPAIRLAAISQLPAIHVFTHDSIALGEDGPTHQPTEHLASLRAIPNVLTIRPCDSNETREAWKAAMANEKGPTALVLTRQGVPNQDRTKLAPADGLHRGAYVLNDGEGRPQAIIMASGSEVSLAMEAQSQLATDGISTRVVSMPSWELFEQQSHSYKEQVLPKTIRARVAVEAGATLGWERYTGFEGKVLGLNRFGGSAPGPELYKQFGFTSENIVKLVKETLA